MIWSLCLDGLVAALLVVAIVLAMILNRRFARLGRDRAEFATLAQEFNAALARAEGSVARLKTTAAGLEAENRRAEVHEDDLRQLIERAEALGDRLEAAVRAVRPHPATVVAIGTRPGAAAAANPPAGAAPAGAPRSEAERDLLQALRFKR